MQLKNVLVIGSAYGGGRAARLLAQGLPKTHRVVIIDKHSHFNHLYLFPRYGVLPGHAQKAFIPDDFLDGYNAQPTRAPAAGQKPISSPSAAADVDGFPANVPLVVHAKVVSIEDGYVELDRDATDASVSQLVLTPEAEGVASVSRITDQLRNGLTFTDRHPKDRRARRRISWDYIVFATGCEMPPALAMEGRTKQEGVDYLTEQTKTVAHAKSILVAGGGALGIQYASDIADLYNNPEHADRRPAGPHPKNITLVHSRPRFMPLYKQALHDAIMRRLETLGVKVILDDRVEMPSVDERLKMEHNSFARTTRPVRTKKGKIIECDLVLQCTGQRPNSTLLREYMPDVVGEDGFVRVKPTLQAAGRIFAIGDVADAGVIKAGHTAWAMGTIAAENIISLINGAREGDLQEYQRTPPMIKVTLGLTNAAAETRPSPEHKDTVVVESSDNPVEGHWEVIWRSRGADPADPTK
ncbi:FAD/NAD(P)-binding domain-containing protein [Exidia glandulosa HHB12029]|uniref:FAD/NAD(P)-binding domain-containing protein n=1 Tax=Exidia glandulosa HHB12029 TaxID=1314781 RepID=A0A165CHZ1_EXIGL|nr:FAD/NAD(P)-binding domain-containing protein [Exidia glandulosa HHB12029]